MGGNLDISWLGGKRYSWRRRLLGGAEGVEDAMDMENK